MQLTEREKELYKQGVEDCKKGYYSGAMGEYPAYLLGYGSEYGKQETLTGQCVNAEQQTRSTLC